MMVCLKTDISDTLTCHFNYRQILQNAMFLIVGGYFHIILKNLRQTVGGKIRT